MVCEFTTLLQLQTANGTETCIQMAVRLYICRYYYILCNSRYRLNCLWGYIWFLFVIWFLVSWVLEDSTNRLLNILSVIKSYHDNKIMNLLSFFFSPISSLLLLSFGSQPLVFFKIICPLTDHRRSFKSRVPFRCVIIVCCILTTIHKTRKTLR